VAITAIALASVARAQSSLEVARVYANPVFVFLSGDKAAQSLAAPQLTQKRVAQAARASQFHDADAGFGLDLLPVLFVGLLSPLSLLSPRSSLSSGCAYPAPILPALFQRPPPASLL
jgi:hypothetical protein